MAQTISSTTPNNSTAYINGNVFTVNESQPHATAFIVSPDGLFTHVGSDAEIRAIAREHHIVMVNLKQQFVMPGIHDAHMHLMYCGFALTSDANIPFDSTSENIASRIKEGSCRCEYINSYQDWIMANAYNNEGFPKGLADRKYLDKLFPDTPVVVLGGAGHSKLLNTEALKRAGYSLTDEPDVQGSKFFRREDGTLTGELGETAMTKAAIAMPSPSVTHTKRVLEKAIHVAHKAGVTSCQEASANTLLLHALRELDAENRLKMDIATHIVYGPEFVAHESAATLHPLLDDAQKFKSKHVDTRFVKIILDGVPLLPLLTHCTLDEHGNADQSKIFVEDVRDAVLKYDKKGMTVKIHCTGQGATRMALDAIEAARRVNPNGPRHEIAHCSGVHEDEYPRFSPLTVTAEMSPALFFTHPVTASSNGLMDWNFPKMLAANAHMTIGSDWGAAPDPSVLPALAQIVETMGGGKKEKGGELLCRMLTLQGAMAVGREKEVGSVEVGKRANFLVVDRDLGRGEFEGARVVRTYFEGECVWDGES
ncbi:amidohydrolase 3 [Lentithecium fluviatile CBS 122367]|uniref:Amidohydrolase 3 n=1 Tax=Lentithecium fluviatile CBS 122367 TaxID=1168545 RepID=A0A6G1JAR4_9PLEO|nr:amidohydrolase 3 [Lentithecium fluviatile CBS 122367]